MLGGELWSMSPLVHPELVTGCLRASLPMKLCGSQGGLFLTLPSVSRLLHLGNALQSSWLSDSAHTHRRGKPSFLWHERSQRSSFFLFFLNRCVLTLRPSPRRLRPGAAAGRGCWTPVGTCSPSWRKRWEWTLPPRTVDTDRRRIEAFGEGWEKRC